MRSLARIETELGRIAARAGVLVGAGFSHLESGDRLFLNAGMSFPMASTYKVAIATRLLHLIDEGDLALDQMVEISQDDLSPGGGMIKAHFSESGIALSVHNLLTVMLTISDNTASDMVLNLAGGPRAVTEFLRASGLEGIRVDRSTKLLITHAYGVSELMPGGEWSFLFFQEHRDVFTVDPQDDSAEVFLNDARDTSTPEAMVTLLERIFRREILSEQSAALLLDIMQRCETGASRLKGMLPSGTVVAHKTGTIEKVAINDVGIITLPDEAGHVVISVFVKAPGKGDYLKQDTAERVIAQVARAVYDFALFAH